ncbi:MAG: TspO/MBR family protein [Ilumatobacteraceae bacterium]
MIMRLVPAIGASIAIVGSSAVLSSVVTARATDTAWYDCVEPGASPPRWVFTVVWTALYALVGVVLSVLLKRGSVAAAGSLCASLALSVAWCAVYFGARMPAGALALLVASAAASAVSLGLAPGAWRVALAPYVAWLFFALVLNAQSAHASRARGCEALKEV